MSFSDCAGVWQRRWRWAAAIAARIVERDADEFLPGELPLRKVNPQSPITLIAGIIAAAVLLLGLNATVIINPGQAGVLSILGSAQDGELLEGLHLKAPFVSVVDIYDVTVQKFEVPAESSTRDLQDLSARFAINFRLDPTQVVNIRRTQGTLGNIVSKIIAPQTQESFKIAAARRTAEEIITRRTELKDDFDRALGERLDKYGIIVLDTSVIDLKFSEEFAKAVEEKTSGRAARATSCVCCARSRSRRSGSHQPC